VPKPFGVFTSVSFQVTCDFGLSKIGLTKQPKGYGLVVIYRKPGLGISNPVEYLFANNVLLPGRLPTGGFYTYEAAPGPLNMAFADLPGESTPTTKTLAFFNLGAGGLVGVGGDVIARRRHGIDITVLPDQVIYLNLDTPNDWRQVTEQEAALDIQKCHWDKTLTQDEIQSATEKFYIRYYRLINEGKMKPGQRLTSEGKTVLLGGGKGIAGSDYIVVRVIYPLLVRRWRQASMSVESAMSFWESRVASRSTKAARIEVYVPLPSASRLGAGLRSTELIIA
jgi:hypothetical protein